MLRVVQCWKMAIPKVAMLKRWQSLHSRCPLWPLCVHVTLMYTLVNNPSELHCAQCDNVHWTLWATSKFQERPNHLCTVKFTVIYFQFRWQWLWSCFEVALKFQLCHLRMHILLDCPTRGFLSPWYVHVVPANPLSKRMLRVWTPDSVIFVSSSFSLSKLLASFTCELCLRLSLLLFDITVNLTFSGFGRLFKLLFLDCLHGCLQTPTNINRQDSVNRFIVWSIHSMEPSLQTG